MTHDQDQFLDVIDRDLAERRFHAAIRREPLGEEMIDLDGALDRVLARDLVSEVDVPSFDRSNYDGFAVQAADTFGATEEDPRRLALLAEVVSTGVVPKLEVASGTGSSIATGGMLPRGADAIVMVEHTDMEGDQLLVRRAVTPGFGVTFTGTDICTGETVLRHGTVLTSRETGVLAAIGVSRLSVVIRPVVAIISTGDEIIRPGDTMRPGLIFDSNAQILADAVRELGGQPVDLGIVRDDKNELRQSVRKALDVANVVLLSGGTSKGQGDLSYRVVEELTDPGVVAHGVALKPGKPICLAASRGKPVVILPGFPTSAIFTFHEFVAPVILALAGRTALTNRSIPARMAVKVNSEIGRTEYLLISFAERSEQGSGQPRLAAYPMGKGSGSVTTFSGADGFVTIGRHEEIVEAGAEVDVQLIGREPRVADLAVIGSHCVGLDFLLGQMHKIGFRTKCLSVGSTAGLAAAERGECDLAGIHLLDAKTGQYNRPFISPKLDLIPGYGRQQGVLFRKGDERFESRSAVDAVATVGRDPSCVMVNRNQGSGTRLLIDRLLDGLQPTGYPVQARNHHAVAAAISQSRADWGVAIESVARIHGLGFLPLEKEQYDFAMPKSRRNRPAVLAFRKMIVDPEVRKKLCDLGFHMDDADQR